jgi:hypothetical protein
MRPRPRYQDQAVQGDAVLRGRDQAQIKLPTTAHHDPALEASANSASNSDVDPGAPIAMLTTVPRRSPPAGINGTSPLVSGR